MALYVSKPQVVEAVQWRGDNPDEVLEFGAGKTRITSAVWTGISGDSDQAVACELLAGKDGAQEWVPVPVGHWLVNQPGDKTDLWPVDHGYFAGKYQPQEWAGGGDVEAATSVLG